MNKHLLPKLILGLLFVGLGSFFWLSTGSLTAQESPIPTEPPVAADAVAIYEARCANCHGPMGGGDGELAAQSPNPPTVFANPAYRQTAVPAELFNTISNGRLARGMPLFGEGSSNPLPPSQIWDLVALIYSFSTPPEQIRAGETLFNELVPEALPDQYNDLRFWSSQSNETLQASFIESGVLPADLDEAEQTAFVDFARTLTYEYVDVALMNAPIETAVISGEVFNGTTETAIGGMDVQLQAFTRDFALMVDETVTADENGRYSFDLSDVDPDLIYLVSTEYGGFSFNSNPNQLDRANPELTMPLTVFDTSTNRENVFVERMQIVVDFFVDDQVRIVELYRFSNEGNALYVGPTGDPADGTVEMSLPAGATNIFFQRGLGSLEDFAQASDQMIRTELGWADTVPLRPGQITTDLLVTYDLPYQPGMTIAHPLPHPVSQALLTVPDVGVTITGGNWDPTGQQVLPAGPVQNYALLNMPEQSVVSFQLNGRPQQVRDFQGNVIQPRYENQELIIGSLMLLGAMLLIAGTVWWTQRRRQLEGDRPEDLLSAIAELDKAFENGRLTASAYRQERQALKADLMLLWQQEG